jgi:hypothetical protein
MISHREAFLPWKKPEASRSKLTQSYRDLSGTFYLIKARDRFYETPFRLKTFSDKFLSSNIIHKFVQK